MHPFEQTQISGPGCVNRSSFRGMADAPSPPLPAAPQVLSASVGLALTDHFWRMKWRMIRWVGSAIGPCSTVIAE
eukprot:10214482-Alexandrium_andersonii.AAC.1